MDLEDEWWEALGLEGGLLELEEVEGILTSWDIISSMGYLAFSTQDASPSRWGSWVDWIGVIGSCGGLGSWRGWWGIIGSWDGVGSWKANEGVLWSWLKIGSCSGMRGSWDGVIWSWHGGIWMDGVEAISSWSGGYTDANLWDGVEGGMCVVHGISVSWLGRGSWDGLGGINGS